jgi:hypothetical protein
VLPARSGVTGRRFPGAEHTLSESWQQAAFLPRPVVVLVLMDFDVLLYLADLKQTMPVPTT